MSATCTRAPGISTIDLHQAMSDYYKSMRGFRPRDIAWDDREAILDMLDLLDAESEAMEYYYAMDRQRDAEREAEAMAEAELVHRMTGVPYPGERYEAFIPHYMEG